MATSPADAEIGSSVDAGSDDDDAAQPAEREEASCKLDRDCRIISEDVSDCDARRIVVSESDPRWQQFLLDRYDVECRVCAGAQDAFRAVCDAGKCKALHYDAPELVACNRDEDCVLSGSVFSLCPPCNAGWDAEQLIAINKHLPPPGAETYNRCAVACPAVACLIQDAGPPPFQPRCSDAGRCELSMPL